MSEISYRYFLFVILVALQACQQIDNSSSHEGSLTPSEALSSFELEPGFKIELLASEPLINSPVDMEIDEFGRLYVVEMPGYPLDKSHTGKIKILSDEDGDGQMDRSVVFAEGLMFPNGILRWKKGVIVTDAPNVLYLEDRDDDGRSDYCDTLLTGFSLSNPHVNVNNPVYGLDNWIYLAHFGSIGTRKYEAEFGDQGTEIFFPQITGSPRLPKNANSRTVRFRPDRMKLEVTSSKTQFGHTFDRWGRHILNHNQNHIYHEVIGAPYLQRNPRLLVTDATESISDHGNETEVFQITTHPDRQLFTPVGLTTSSSGITAYLGGLFPPPYDRNVVFDAESVSNFIHLDILQDSGSTFVASRHRPRKEFLASTDSWSRPVNMYIGPDGALYVLDYYRRIIEHPEWMSDEAVAAGGLYDGHDMGRIYRITPVGTGKPTWTKGLDFGHKSTADWVQSLSSTNIWWRQNAQRLLVDKADSATIPALEMMAENYSSPEGRLHALWTLQGMGVLTPKLVQIALTDSVSGIRENAVKLTELYLASNPGLHTALFALKDDPDPKVRFQLLCTLGFIDTPLSAEVREELLFRDIKDEWVQIAALTAPASRAPQLLGRVLVRIESGCSACPSLVRRLTSMITAGDNAEEVRRLLQKALASTGKEIWQAPVIDGITDGLRSKPRRALLYRSEQQQLAKAFFSHPNESVREACLSLLEIVGLPDDSQQQERSGRAISIIKDASIQSARRVQALRFISLGNVQPHSNLLKDLIVAEEHTDVQIAALQTLGKIPGTGNSDYLVQHWSTLTPGVRDAALETFMSDTVRERVLLDAIESQKISESDIGWKRTVRLMSSPHEELREKARRLLHKEQSEYTGLKYNEALKMQGTADNGKLVYQKKCASCHQLGEGEGVAFGPNLRTVHNWRPVDLMANILDPNLAIAPGFDLWEVTMKNGVKVQGMIMSETSSAIRLRTSPGVESTVNRVEIETIMSLNTSLMPPMTGQIDEKQMADLLAYLKK